jgi:hypothetical protein
MVTLEECGFNVDLTTVLRRIQDYGHELEQRLRRHLKPENKSQASGQNLRSREGSILRGVGYSFNGGLEIWETRST